MPQYHFHSDDGVNPIGDTDGRELPDDQTAIEEACSAAIEALQQDVTEGASAARVVVTLMRGDGVKVAAVTMQATLERFT